ncbi:hypothetical protein RHO12_11780 [Orbus sturtevantii]
MTQPRFEEVSVSLDLSQVFLFPYLGIDVDNALEISEPIEV